MLKTLASARADPDPRSRIRVRMSAPGSAMAWLVGWMLAAVAVHAAFLATPLHIDEAGVALVGHSMLNAHDHGSSLYGHLWLDRSPLLVLIFGVASALAGPIGIRLVGLFAAAASVLVITKLAAVVGGGRAARAAAPLSALLVSAPALGAHLTYPELVALPLSAGALLCVLRPGTRRTSWLVAGALAVASALIKQSFIDAAAATVAAAIVLDQAPRVHTRLAFLGCGMAIPLMGIFGWAQLDGPGIDPLLYAMAGFRFDAAQALAQSNVPMTNRFTLLATGLVAAAVPLLAVPALSAMRDLWRNQRRLSIVLAVWLAAAFVGVLGGGYYWPHYEIEVIGPMVVLASTGVATMRSPHATSVITTLVALTVVVGGTLAYSSGWLNVDQRGVRPTAEVVADNRLPGDSTFVLWARANVLYYTHTAPAFPYQWSSMYRAMPDVEQQAEDLLGSRNRPTWIIEWQHPSSFQLDQDNDIRALISGNYRVVAIRCGHLIWLRADDPRLIYVARTHACEENRKSQPTKRHSRLHGEDA